MIAQLRQLCDVLAKNPAPLQALDKLLHAMGATLEPNVRPLRYVLWTPAQTLPLRDLVAAFGAYDMVQQVRWDVPLEVVFAVDDPMCAYAVTLLAEVVRVPDEQPIVRRVMLRRDPHAA